MSLNAQSALLLVAICAHCFEVPQPPLSTRRSTIAGFAQILHLTNPEPSTFHPESGAKVGGGVEPFGRLC